MKKKLGIEREKGQYLWKSYLQKTKSMFIPKKLNGFLRFFFCLKPKKKFKNQTNR